MEKVKQGDGEDTGGEEEAWLKVGGQGRPYWGEPWAEMGLGKGSHMV